MTFKVEFDDDVAVEWATTGDGATATRNPDYTPSIYVDAPDTHLSSLAATLEDDPKVVDVGHERWFASLRDDERTRVLRVDLERAREVRTLAREVRHRHEMDDHAPGTFRLYNVDLSPQFRYCLATGTDPVPDGDLATLSVRAGEKPLADGDVSTLELGGDAVSGAEDVVLETLDSRLRRVDPDVLVLSDAALVPLLFEKAGTYGHDDFRLGREPGYTRLAGANTFESYGQVGHSPARYDVPGRVVVDESNSFLWSETTLEGLLDLVDHSGKPLQETAWASIGNVLTAVQIREAIERDVLVPWNKWEPEQFKDVRTLHAADRGGFTFAPDVGVHDDVVEIDFSSLYPRIMVTRNISPDTVRCDCHADREDVPGLGYAVCDDRGFLADVLEPLLDHRASLKERRRRTDDPDRAATLRKRSNAFKWILVSCFGYQGYRNSKFGRIEAHEAINAVARDVLLETKAICERHGWEVKHGIVDSLWVAPRDPDPAPIEAVTDAATEAVGIPLEFQLEYDWVAFVPRRDSSAGALTKYFGTVAGEDDYKVRGIEARQRSTPPFVADAQLELVEALDATRDPAELCTRLQSRVATLRDGDVDVDDLLVRTRVSKPLSEYSQRNHTVAALRRAREHDVSYSPGEDVRSVVVDDDARTADRVRLHFEDVDDYDAEYYVTLLVRAAESVCSPLGWDRSDVRRELADRVDATLDSFAR
jgi:DNA polymerase I